MIIIKMYSNTHFIDNSLNFRYFSLINQPFIYFAITSSSIIKKYIINIKKQKILY